MLKKPFGQIDSLFLYCRGIIDTADPDASASVGGVGLLNSQALPDTMPV
jgi:hypothetical protein